MRTDDIEVIEGVIEGTEQIDVKIEGSDEFIAVVGVQADWHFVIYFRDDDEGAVEKHHDIVVFLFIVVLIHFNADGVVEGDNLVGQIIEEDEWTFEGLHFHGIFIVHFILEPLHKLSHKDVYHIFFKSILLSMDMSDIVLAGVKYIVLSLLSTIIGAYVYALINNWIVRQDEKIRMVKEYGQNVKNS